MFEVTDDARIVGYRPLLPPAILLEELPLTEHASQTVSRGRRQAERIIQVSAQEGLTLRQAAYRFGQWKSDFVGSPETIANEIERWFVGRAADGFNLRVTRPGDFALFRERVVPILQERGLFRKKYEHDTLRGHLGLPLPENRYAKAQSEAQSEQQSIAAE